jgi:DNA-binding NtrC family response regulator
MRVRTKCVIISLLTTAEESGRPTILVDDQEIIAATTAEILNRFGFRAVRTYDAQRRADCREAQAGLLLTDVSMPIMKGVELVITKLLPATKILLFPASRASQILCAREKKRLFIRCRCQTYPSRETDGTAKKKK